MEMKYIQNILATSKVISGQVPTCDGGHSWRFYSAAPLGNHTVGAITRYSTQSHYRETELTSPCPILLMPSTRRSTDLATAPGLRCGRSGVQFPLELKTMTITIDVCPFQARHCEDRATTD